MRKIFIVVIVFTLGYFVVESDIFNAIFNKDFYNPIFMSPFDVSTKGNKIEIPLRYVYRTEYGFAICVPYEGDPLNNILKDLDGALSFSFVSKDHVVKKEIIKNLKLTGLFIANGRHEGVVYTFDLPLHWWGGASKLIVEVISPITKLSKYKGKVICIVSPSYVL
ncbi:hypothetical protein [Pseudodesulfovibrio karagichevae]|uniref:Uncharacterized protein n=1 Tax=Pseudodesulfovibrio karagichevae TaxID=3239305 RepID=A0ABV4K6Y8_9BACT